MIEAKTTWMMDKGSCELCESTVNLKKLKSDCGVLICEECSRMDGTPISNALHVRASKLSDDELSYLIDKKQL